MRINVRLDSLAPNIPGQAQMSIKNWSGEVSGLKFTVQRHQDLGYLNGVQHDWSNSEYWFQLSSVEQDGEFLRVNIGADLLDPLLEDINANYRITLRNNDGVNQSGTLKIASSLLPSSALGSSQAHQASGHLSSPVSASVPEPQAEPQPEPEFSLDLPAEEPEPQIVVEEQTPVAAAEPVVSAPPAPSPQASNSSSKRVLIIILLVLLLLAIAGAAWWFLQKKDSVTSPVAVVEQSAAGASSPAPVAAGVCSLASMQAHDELTFIQNCLQESNDSQALLEVIGQAKANSHCGIAQRLYANRAQSGDALIALAYAKEYDPEFFVANDCFKEANTETAVYWYETVLLNQPDNAEAAQRLEGLVQ